MDGQPNPVVPTVDPNAPVVPVADPNAPVAPAAEVPGEVSNDIPAGAPAEDEEKPAEAPVAPAV